MCTNLLYCSVVLDNMLSSCICERHAINSKKTHVMEVVEIRVNPLALKEAQSTLQLEASAVISVFN